jgi:hypothetical protein
VFAMGGIQSAVENRRKHIIDTLIAFNIYKKQDKHLFELSLTELESEYKTFHSQNHPHGDFGSIQLFNCKKRQRH